MEYKIPVRNKNKEIVNYCIVTKEDYDILNNMKWHLSKKINGYASTSINNTSYLMHRYIFIKILNHNIDSNVKIDHINSNKLDNRRENLRIVSDTENSRNKSKQKNSISKYFGVRKDKEKWITTIINYDLYASYNIEEHAAYQYDLWIEQYKITHSKKNNIEKPDNFVEYKKQEKIADLPKGVRMKNNKFYSTYNNKHIGMFDTIELAAKAYDEYVKNVNINKIKSKNNIPIIKINDQTILFLNDKKHNMKFTIIDESLYYELNKYSWHDYQNSGVSGFVNNKTIKLHRFIMNYIGKDFIDHINNNPYDNRKCNLRIVTHQQNMMNQSSSKNSTSKYIGVHFDKSRNKWQAKIMIDGKNINLGRFDNEVEAAKARDIATKEHFGKYGNLNFKVYNQLLET
jgi:hypothetical protein